MSEVTLRDITKVVLSKNLLIAGVLSLQAKFFTHERLHITYAQAAVTSCLWSETLFQVGLSANGTCMHTSLSFTLCTLIRPETIKGNIRWKTLKSFCDIVVRCSSWTGFKAKEPVSERRCWFSGCSGHFCLELDYLEMFSCLRKFFFVFEYLSDFHRFGYLIFLNDMLNKLDVERTKKWYDEGGKKG